MSCDGRRDRLRRLSVVGMEVQKQHDGGMKVLHVLALNCLATTSIRGLASSSGSVELFSSFAAQRRQSWPLVPRHLSIKFSCPFFDHGPVITGRLHAESTPRRQVKVGSSHTGRIRHFTVAAANCLDPRSRNKSRPLMSAEEIGYSTDAA